MVATTDLPGYALSFHQGCWGSPLHPLDLLRVEALGVTPVALLVHHSKFGSDTLPPFQCQGRPQRHPRTLLQQYLQVLQHLFCFFFKKNQKFILQCSVAVRMPNTRGYKVLLPMSRCY